MVIRRDRSGCGSHVKRGEVEFAGGDAPDDVDEQAALDGLDAVVQRVLVVPGQHGHALLREDRPAVDAVVDDDDARAGLRDAGRERVAHAVGAGELGQVRRVRVDDPRRPRVDERGGQQPHETAQHHEVGLPDCDLRGELGAPLLAASRTARHGTMNGRDAELLGVREALGLAVGADGDDPRRELGFGRRIEQGAQVRPAPEMRTATVSTGSVYRGGRGVGLRGPRSAVAVLSGSAGRGRSDAAACGSARESRTASAAPGSGSARDAARLGIRHRLAVRVIVRGGFRAPARESSRIAAPNSTSTPTARATAPGCGPTSASRPGPIDPEASADSSAAPAADRTAMPSATPLARRSGRSCASSARARRCRPWCRRSPRRRRAERSAPNCVPRRGRRPSRSAGRPARHPPPRAARRDGTARSTRRAHRARPAAARAAAARGWWTPEARRAPECRGSSPSWVPAGETAVPVPTANPGPATNAMPQIARVGR